MDTHFRVRGPAVHGLQVAFYGNWVEAGGLMTHALSTVAPLESVGEARIQVIRATAAVGWSDMASLLQTIICGAQKSLRVVTPYLAPDEASTRLLVEAANRGVAIELIIPGPHSDQRISRLAGASELQQLLQAGVKIWRYQSTMIHAKIVIIDGIFVCIGSAKVNHRSTLKDDEIALVTDCHETVSTLEQNFGEDLRQCKRLDFEAWRNRGILRRSGEALAA